MLAATLSTLEKITRLLVWMYNHSPASLLTGDINFDDVENGPAKRKVSKAAYRAPSRPGEDYARMFGSNSASATGDVIINQTNTTTIHAGNANAAEVKQHFDEHSEDQVRQAGSILQPFLQARGGA
jgi:hypothetical protein